MCKKILFSPVGGTDPISEDNYYEGSMLHICRYFKPDLVYLYMSKTIVNNEEKDHRYTEALKLLGDKVNHRFEVKLIRNETLTTVHEFDYFYDEFSKVVKKIFSENSPDDEFYFNISSGTPGMKSALIVMKSLGEFNGTCVQVASPSRKMENHTHSKGEYDLTSLWELSPDNDEHAVNRTQIVECPNLVCIRTKRNIEEFIKKYDYEAAYQMLHFLPEMDKFEPYLRLAKSRYNLNLSEANKLNSELKVNFLPVIGPDQKIFEYALACNIKRKKGELADFIRALTPLILELFVMIAKKQIGEISSLTKDCHTKNGIKIEVWDKQSIIDLAFYNEHVATIKTALADSYRDFFEDVKLSEKNYIRSDHICTILKYPTFELGKIADDVVQLRERVEQTIRNMSAHQMVQVDEEQIKKLTGIDSRQIMKLIKRLFSYSGINIGETSPLWDSYDKMNDFIIQKLNEK
ncbi:MAG: type III-A CRISPR-associated CARF protein Csm6 [Succinivibrio sp.]